MTNAAATGPIRATLIDITNCIGCRACQVACKQWNERDGEQTELEARTGFSESGYAQLEDIHAHRVPRDGEPAEAGRLGVRLRDAAVPSLSGTGLRLGLSDDGTLPPVRWSGDIRS